MEIEIVIKGKEVEEETRRSTAKGHLGGLPGEALLSTTVGPIAEVQEGPLSPTG